MHFSSITAEQIDVFGCGDGVLADVSQLLARMWASGAGRPEWCWVATGGGRVLARVGVQVVEDPAAIAASVHPDVEPDLLAEAWSRVPYTVGLFGLAYVPGRAGMAAAIRLVRQMIERLDLPPGTVIEARTNRESHPDPTTRCRLLEDAGFRLFQEKQGYAWSAPSGPEAADGGLLSFATFPAVGAHRFLAVMAEAGAHTLDRNDRYYYELCRPRGWARVMLEYVEPSISFLGYDHGGDEAGFVAVSAFDEPGTATITHIGVPPRQRGHGYGRHLLAAATRAAEAAGFTAMLSDVDVHNEPMAAAMRAVGHRDNRRPWHIWHHRLVT